MARFTIFALFIVTQKIAWSQVITQEEIKFQESHGCYLVDGNSF